MLGTVSKCKEQKEQLTSISFLKIINTFGPIRNRGNITVVWTNEHEAVSSASRISSCFQRNQHAPQILLISKRAFKLQKEVQISERSCDRKWKLSWSLLLVKRQAGCSLRSSSTLLELLFWVQQYTGLGIRKSVMRSGSTSIKTVRKRER